MGLIVDTGWCRADFLRYRPNRRRFTGLCRDPHGHFREREPTPSPGVFKSHGLALPRRPTCAGDTLGSSRSPFAPPPVIFLPPRMNKHLALCALLLVAVGSSPAIAQTAKPDVTPVVKTSPAVVKLGTGFDYSTGKYGFTQATDVWSVPLNASYEQGRWVFKTTIPYISIKGPASVVVGTGGAEGAPPRPTSNTESGLGDVTFSGTFHARPVPGELNVDLTARVKLGTASESKGLGTGETDYYTQIDLYQSFGNLTPFATFGYRFLGRNASFALKDGPYATIGAAVRVSETVVVGAGYDWRSRIITGAQNGTDALGFVAVTPTPHWSLLGYLIAGFNAASPDLGLGGQATYKF